MASPIKEVQWHGASGTVPLSDERGLSSLRIEPSQKLVWQSTIRAMRRLKPIGCCRDTCAVVLPSSSIVLSLWRVLRSLSFSCFDFLGCVSCLFPFFLSSFVDFPDDHVDHPRFVCGCLDSCHHGTHECACEGTADPSKCASQPHRRFFRFVSCPFHQLVRCAHPHHVPGDRSFLLVARSFDLRTHVHRHVAPCSSPRSSAISCIPSSSPSTGPEDSHHVFGSSLLGVHAGVASFPRRCSFPSCQNGPSVSWMYPLLSLFPRHFPRSHCGSCRVRLVRVREGWMGRSMAPSGWCVGLKHTHTHTHTDGWTCDPGRVACFLRRVGSTWMCHWTCS